MPNRTDELNFAIFTLHGDCCNCIEGDCASGFSRKDYVLSAKFAYLLEALDVIEKWNSRGVNCRLRSPRYGTCDFDWSEYPVKKSESQ